MRRARLKRTSSRLGETDIREGEGEEGVRKNMCACVSSRWGGWWVEMSSSPKNYKSVVGGPHKEHEKKAVLPDLRK